MNGREAHAGALEFTSAVEALKCLEQLVGVLHVEARTVVADRVNDVSVFIAARRNFDLGCLAQLRVLEGVAQEVEEHLLEQRRVRLARQVLLHLYDRVAMSAAEFVQAFGNELTNVDDAPLNGLAAETREGEEVVDESPHA